MNLQQAQQEMQERMRAEPNEKRIAPGLHHLRDRPHERDFYKGIVYAPEYVRELASICRKAAKR